MATIVLLVNRGEGEARLLKKATEAPARRRREEMRTFLPSLKDAGTAR